MSEPHTPIDQLPDPLRRSGAATDQPLSLEGRTPGRSGLGGKMGLAGLGLLILFAMALVMGIGSWAIHEGQTGKPASVVDVHP